MTQTAEKLLSDAMKLEESERAELAAKLMDTLDPATDVNYAESWQSEIEARVEDLRSGKVKAVPFSGVPEGRAIFGIAETRPSGTPLNESEKT